MINHFVTAPFLGGNQLEFIGCRDLEIPVVMKTGREFSGSGQGQARKWRNVTAVADAECLDVFLSAFGNIHRIPRIRHGAVDIISGADAPACISGKKRYRRERKGRLEPG